ncbi:unnamed protein product, partial [Ixodes pacificus]
FATARALLTGGELSRNTLGCCGKARRLSKEGGLFGVAEFDILIQPSSARFPSSRKLSGTAARRSRRHAAAPASAVGRRACAACRRFAERDGHALLTSF